MNRVSTFVKDSDYPELLEYIRKSESEILHEYEFHYSNYHNMVIETSNEDVAWNIVSGYYQYI